MIRTIHPVIPPRVEYRLTDLGLSLGEAFCGVRTWAETNLARIEAFATLSINAANIQKPVQNFALFICSQISRRCIHRCAIGSSTDECAGV